MKQDSQNKSVFPDIKDINIETLRMKPIDLEKIYSETQKNENSAMVNIFFDKNRKLRRYADGTRLIKQFVSPIYSHKKVRSMTKEEKTIKDKAIKRSYENSPEVDKQKERIKQQSDTFLQQYQLPFIMQSRDPYSQRCDTQNEDFIQKTIDTQQQYQDTSLENISNTKQKQKDKNISFLFGLEDSSSLMRDDAFQLQSTVNLGESQLKTQYEKDYTRLQFIKNASSTNYKGTNDRRIKNKSLSKNLNKDINSLLNSTNLDFFKTKDSGFQNEQPQIRLIAPFIENHLKRLKETNYDIERVNKQDKDKQEEMRSEFKQRWKQFDQTTLNYANQVSSQFSKNNGNFKVISLRKQFY